MSNMDWVSGGNGEGEAGNVNCNDTLSKKRYSGMALYTKTKPINVKYGMDKQVEWGGAVGMCTGELLMFQQGIFRNSSLY